MTEVGVSYRVAFLGALLTCNYNTFFWARYRRFIDFFTLKVIVRVDVSSDHMNKSSHNNNARVGASHLTSYIYCMGNKWIQTVRAWCVCVCVFINKYYMLFSL